MASNGEDSVQTNSAHHLGNGTKHILLNAFDMSTIGHLSPGQWKVCVLSIDFWVQFWLNFSLESDG